LIAAQSTGPEPFELPPPPAAVVAEPPFAAVVTNGFVVLPLLPHPERTTAMAMTGTRRRVRIGER
jgi:hypothetical protein